jgi:hypothetical protein
MELGWIDVIGVAFERYVPRRCVYSSRYVRKVRISMHRLVVGRDGQKDEES